MTEAEVKVLAASAKLAAARRAWLEATALSQELYKQHQDAERREARLDDELTWARRELELAVYDAADAPTSPDLGAGGLGQRVGDDRA